MLWQVETARSSGLTWWSLLQLLLVLLPLAGLLLVPNLAARLPNFNAHILPAKVNSLQAPSCRFLLAVLYEQISFLGTCDLTGRKDKLHHCSNPAVCSFQKSSESVAC